MPTEPDHTVDPEERDLIARCRQGDRNARRTLFERTSDRIYRLLLRMTGNADDAFDLAQETYLRAFTEIGKFDGRSNVATWLYRVAVNEALQCLRRRRTGRARLETLSAIRSDGRSADDDTARLDVEAALRTLPEDERAAVLLRYQEGLDYRAIAAVLGCAEGTVASRLNRARTRLRQQLQAGYGREEETSDPVHQKR